MRRKFVIWLESSICPSLQGVFYAVFGCGHQDWSKTLYRIPILIDKLIQKAGATRLVTRGKANTAVSDLFSALEAWEENILLPVIREKFLLSRSNDGELLDPHPLQLSLGKPMRVGMHPDIVEPSVTGVRILGSPGTPKNVMRSSECPPGQSTKDGLESLGSIQPRRITLSRSSHSSRSNINALAFAQSDQDSQELLHFHDSYHSLVRDKRVSVVGLLEQFSLAALPVATFISVLLALLVRLYSLSMAPTFKPLHGSLTFSVANELAWSGNGRHLGIDQITSPRSRQDPGATHSTPQRKTLSIYQGIIPAHQSSFIVICAGSGLCPFYSFTQERIVWLQQGKALAKALLFFSCRGSSLDDLYYDELCEFESAGVVTVHRAYRRDPEHHLVKRCLYVTHRLVVEAQAIKNLWVHCDDLCLRVEECG
ncbi:NADPH cytochrome P450 oxidoreductase family protein [Aspergillus novofumigatus IBT 16806]|uniref:Flavodoxin-like domain-containing protein n=1 Tax=Aspergillus novofumigatus (strain IBT 16806) TaxID=1392255 RepID=A0A2I1C3U6_ASPN1|nr:uncharacterized protein P174DRAFT_504497 [Aspergillus novofumigatus IBT 16806]PKX92278.1 hypothetical protein P174DRAFT_504497 [Aspergillus novofumigatus IBT 16806]